MLVAGMPMAFADGHASDGLTITADAVEGSTTITITGHATSSNTPVTVMVLAPNGNVVSIDQINPDSDGSFTSTEFFAEIEGHPEDANVKLALEELSYYSTYIKMLGSFTSHS